MSRAALILVLGLAAALGCGEGDCERCGDAAASDGEARTTSTDDSPSGGVPTSPGDDSGEPGDDGHGTGSGSDTGADTADPTTRGGEDEFSDDGYVSVVWARADSDPPTAFVIGQLYQVLSPGEPAVHFAQPQGLDDCALTSFTVEDLQMGVLPTYEHQSASTLSLLAGSSAIEVAPSGPTRTYYRDLDPATVPLGGSYDVEAPGDTFPAFSGELALPASRQMLAPSPGFVAEGPLTVQWSGGAPGEELLLRLEGMNDAGDRALVICRLSNDGAHAVPAAIVSALPSGRLSVHLEQKHRTDLRIGERALRLTGSVVDIVVGSVP